MNEHEKINYVEFRSSDLAATKAFFQAAFGWEFEDFGDQYTAFSGEGLDGGFYASPQSASTETGSALIVLYSEDIAQTQSKVESAGGSIVKTLFPFPGGQRFHFLEPGGNELAVWSDK